MSDSDDPAPDFGTSTIPGLAAFLAAHEAGLGVRQMARGAFAKTQAGIPEVLEQAGTPLKDLAAFTEREVADLTDFAASKGVTARMVASGQGQRGSFYQSGEGMLERLLGRLEGPGPQGEIVGLRSASMPVALHELGHATPILGSPALRNAWQGMARALGDQIPGKLLRGGLIGNALTNPDEDEGSVRGFAREHAPGLVAATYAPELLEEARATVSALRGAGKYGPGVAAVAREMLPAFGTYAAHAAAPALATLIAQKLMEVLRNRGEEKSAAATVGKEVQSPGILRASASSAWHTGLSAPKPKTTKPNTNPEGRAKETVKAKPPSKTSYFTDTIKSLYNPQRGYRGAKPG